MAFFAGNERSLNISSQILLILTLAVVLASPCWALEIPVPEMLVPIDGIPGDGFGLKVAVSGDTLVIGSNHSDTGDLPRGAIYIYEWSGGLWQYKQHLDPAPGCSFMTGDLAISGDFIAAACSLSEPVLLFRRVAGSWTHFQTITRTNALHDAFPSGLDLCGSFLAVGAPQATYDSKQTGSVVVYRFNGTSWLKTQELIPTDLDFWNGTWIGEDVDMTSDYVVAKSRKNRVIVWTRDESNWSWSASLYSSAWGYPDSLTVDTNGNVAASSREDVAGLGQGAVYVWTRTGPANWQLANVLYPQNATPWGEFGNPVEFAGDYLVVGHPTNSNSYRLYELAADGWMLDQILYPPLEGGRQISGDRFTWIVGAVVVQPDAGAAFLYDFFASSGGIFRDGFESGDSSRWSE